MNSGEGVSGDPFTTPLRSMADIHALERASALGAPVAGEILRALLARWNAGLRDEECLLHFVYVGHQARSKAGWRAGTLPEVPGTGTLVSELGGLDALGAEACFALAWIGQRDAESLTGLEGPGSAPEELAARAARLAPRSPLFAQWSFFLGRRDAAEDVHRQRRALLNEAHARFAGRGAVGASIEPILRRSIRNALRAPRIGP